RATAGPRGFAGATSIRTDVTECPALDRGTGAPGPAARLLPSVPTQFERGRVARLERARDAGPRGGRDPRRGRRGLGDGERPGRPRGRGGDGGRAPGGGRRGMGHDDGGHDSAFRPTPGLRGRPPLRGGGPPARGG